MAYRQLALIILIFSTFLTVSGPVHAYMTPPARVLIQKEIQQLKFFFWPKRRLFRQRSQVHCYQKEEQSCEKWTFLDLIFRCLMLISGILVSTLLIFGIPGTSRTTNKLFLSSDPPADQCIGTHEETDRDGPVCADNPEPAVVEHAQKSHQSSSLDKLHDESTETEAMSVAQKRRTETEAA